jgi:hypothetical protein
VLQRDVLAEIKALRERMPHLTGVLAATTDGLLVAQDAPAVEPEAMAAMAAANLGLGRQISLGAAQGPFCETVTRAEDGYVATFAAGEHALLAVFASPDLNVGRLYHEARPVAARVGELIARLEPGHAAGSIATAAGRANLSGRHTRSAEGA